MSIDASGRVTDVEVLRGLPMGLSDAAVDAVRRWTWKPARSPAGPVASRRTVRIRFTLGASDGAAIARPRGRPRGGYNFVHSMLQVLYEWDGRPQIFTVSKDVASIGRANDNDIVLNDFSVSRRHAYIKREQDEWVIYDNQSTNGVRVNDKAVPRAVVADGDQVLIGTFLLRFKEEADAPPAPRPRMIDSTSTRIRPIAEFNEDYGLEPGIPAPPPDSTADRKRAAPDAAYRNRVFEILVQVARALISADDLETVLDKVMDLIFEFLPVDRAFLLLEEEGGALQLRISRYRSKRRPTSDGTAPYSRTIVDMVVKQKVGDPDLRRADRPAVRVGRVDPHAADPVRDVRAALERRVGHRRRSTWTRRCTREASRTRTST